MSVATELHTSLRTMDFVQMLLALGFLAAYSVTCSGLFEARGRLRAAVSALVCGIAFAAFTAPWVNGAMLLVGAIAAIGLLSGAVWAVDRALRLHAGDMAAPRTIAAVSTEPSIAAPAPRALPRDGVHAGPDRRRRVSA
jgi:glucose uptake protein GlcU